MRNIKLAVTATFAVASTMASATPTVVGTPTVTVTGTVYTSSSAEMQTACTAQIAPANAAKFTARVARGSVVTDSSNSTISNDVTLGGGDPVYGDPVAVGLARNPGVDKQIFERIDWTTVTTPSSTHTWTDTKVETKHLTFGCDFYNQQGHLAADQSINGLNSATWTVTTVTNWQDVTSGGTTALNPTVFDEYKPVCQADHNGVWAVKVGSNYDESLGACTQATYDGLEGYPWNDQ